AHVLRRPVAITGRREDRCPARHGQVPGAPRHAKDALDGRGAGAMSTRDHGLIEELLAVRALGGLGSEDEATLHAAMTAHGDCETCRQLETGFEETAGLLGFALDPVPVRDELADRVLDRARGAGRASGRRPRRRAALVAVAAAPVVVAAGVATPRPPTPPIVS